MKHVRDTNTTIKGELEGILIVPNQTSKARFPGFVSALPLTIRTIVFASPCC
jgi:hypothetical protein